MKEVKEKAKGLARQAELKLKIVEKEAQKATLAAKLGNEVIETYPAIDIAAVSTIVEEVKKIDAEIAEHNNEINQLKGVKKCPSCGALIKDTMRFCGQCGEKLVEDEPKEKEAPEATDEVEITDETEAPLE